MPVARDLEELARVHGAGETPSHPVSLACCGGQTPAAPARRDPAHCAPYTESSPSEALAATLDLPLPSFLLVLKVGVVS